MLVAAHLSAIPPPAAGAQRFRDAIGVTVVEVPVQVLRDGRPVRGLTAADFELYDRGEMQKITGFEVVDLTGRAAPAPEAPSGPTAAAAAVRSARGRHLLLLFDFAFSRPHLLGRALAGVRQMMASGLHPADRVALAVYGGAGAGILVGFTTDRTETERGLAFIEALLDRDSEHLRQLSAELSGADDEEEVAARRRRELRRLSRQLGPVAALALSGPLAPAAVDSPEGAASVTRRAGLFGLGSSSLPGGLTEAQLGPLSPEQILRAAETEAGLHGIATLGESLAELATLLRGVPQPKHLLYLSEGFPTAYLADRRTRGRVVSQLQPMVDAFRSSGWALQAIDVEGVPDLLHAAGRSAAAAGTLGSTRMLGYEVMRGTSRRPGAGFDAEALFHMAAETGGEVIENHNDVEDAAAKVLERTAVTYLLAFQPTALNEDGSYHELEVRLKKAGDGTRLRHRLGYHAPRPGADRSALERGLDEAELITGEREIAGIPARALAYPAPTASPEREIPVLVEVPGAAWLGSSTGEARVRLEVYALGADAEIHDVSVQQILLDRETVGPRLRQGGLRFSTTVAVPPGRQRVRVILRNLDTGELAARNVPVDVPAVGSALPFLLPPVFVDRTGRFLDARAEPRGPAADAGTKPGPFRLGDSAFSPWLAPELAPEREEIVFLTAYLAAGSTPSLASRVLDANGSAVDSGELRWILRQPDADDGSTRLLAAFRPAGLEPGAYRLEITLLDTASGSSVADSCGFTVAPF